LAQLGALCISNLCATKPTRNEKITPNKIIGFLRLHCPEILAYELFKVNDQTLKLESINKFNFNKI